MSDTSPTPAAPRPDTEVIASLARLEGKVDTTNARLEAHLERTRDELNALFRIRKEHAAKIGAIELDYVPQRIFESYRREQRTDFDRHEQDQRSDFVCLRSAVDGIKTQVTKVMAVGGCLYLVALIILKLWGKV